MTLKEFTTAAHEVDAGDDIEMQFVVDGKECRAYRPSNGQLAILMASVSSTRQWSDQVAGIINFFAAVLDNPSNDFLTRKLLDRNDPFGLDEVQEIIEWMIGEWSARPTQSPSGSTPSRQNGGRKSTPRTRRSTSSVSTPAVSADSSTPGA